MTEIDFSNITQVAFSIGVAWYLLTVINKKLDNLSKLVEGSIEFNKSTLEMFTELKTLIAETSKLVQTTKESMQILSELTKNALRQLEDAQWHQRNKDGDKK